MGYVYLPVCLSFRLSVCLSSTGTNTNRQISATIKYKVVVLAVCLYVQDHVVVCQYQFARLSLLRIVKIISPSECYMYSLWYPSSPDTTSSPSPPPSASPSELLSSFEDSTSGPFPYHVTLDPFGGFQLNWTVSPDRQKVTFHIHAQVNVDGTLAFGFSDRGRFDNAGRL